MDVSKNVMDRWTKGRTPPLLIIKLYAGPDTDLDTLYLVRRNKNRPLYKLKNLHLYSLDMDTRKRFGVKISFCKSVSWTIFTFLAFLLSSNSKILYFQYNSLTLWKFIEITMKMNSGATLRIRRYVTLYINYLLLNFTR